MYEIPYQQAMGKGNSVRSALSTCVFSWCVSYCLKGKEGFKKKGPESEPSACNPLHDLLRQG